jgi:hypothetical protein
MINFFYFLFLSIFNVFLCSEENNSGNDIVLCGGIFDPKEKNGFDFAYDSEEKINPEIEGEIKNLVSNEMNTLLRKETNSTLNFKLDFLSFIIAFNKNDINTNFPIIIVYPFYTKNINKLSDYSSQELNKISNENSKFIIEENFLKEKKKSDEAYKKINNSESNLRKKLEIILAKKFENQINDYTIKKDKKIKKLDNEIEELNKSLYIEKFENFKKKIDSINKNWVVKHKKFTKYLLKENKKISFNIIRHLLFKQFIILKCSFLKFKNII